MHWFDTWYPSKCTWLSGPPELRTKRAIRGEKNTHQPKKRSEKKTETRAQKEFERRLSIGGADAKLEEKHSEVENPTEA